jgi:glycosyltransferase involved in cell wall biosynthesis
VVVVVHYQGDDARQGDYLLQHYDVSIATQVPRGYYSPETDAFKRRQIAWMGRRAQVIYAVNPDLMNVLPDSAEFVPYGHVPIQDWRPSFTQAEHERLVFAHAPSNRGVKGTDLILDALHRLAGEGYAFDLDLIEGVSNETALDRYRRADVVIDQLYAGWYGGVALEAMALGKPVVAYLRESDLRFLPAGMAAELPILRATPSTITDDLRSILEMSRTELVDRAKASRAFVEHWHDPVAITARIADGYRRAIASTGHRRRGSA